MLKQAMASILTPEETEELYGAFDQIGSIIILRIPDALLSKKKLIGEILLEKVKTAKSIFYQSSPVEGDYRIRQLELLAGEDNTVTEYKEHGCRFKVDVEKTFFSPRLATERLRIADLVKDGEVIINMFGGVGMFSIVAAKKKKCHVYNIDINPHAARLCSENVILNKLKGTVESIEGDATEIIEKQLVGKGDRVLMLLPERSDEFLDIAIKALKQKGVLHYYCHIHSDKKNQLKEVVTNHFLSVVKVKSEVLGSKIVRPVGPRFYQAVVDAVISK
ncbi:tRNA (guanine(37)-N(1))-methyltransferase [Candidatus Nitrosotalea sp. TS]|uniref:class I SAM-dependent methyltransferase n=1 Tax=Candidatus Nitrosotalea sp. TS TaxID=2341020 RepID=UPI00140AA5B0|nr:class I SAM-dependent methyltransferase family protein [Candidatus Nitrosotalea sp. TS]NHI03396.1 tRNA (guanine(37)-N(1))-methyltransferase [Candidatus Nitrosotalea sp. TS]